MTLNFAANKARNGAHFQYHSRAAGGHLLHPVIRRNRRLWRCGRRGCRPSDRRCRANLPQDRRKDQLRRRRCGRGYRHLQLPAAVRGRHHDLHRLHRGIYGVVHRRLRQACQDEPLRPDHDPPAYERRVRQCRQVEGLRRPPRADREHAVRDLRGAHGQERRRDTHDLHGWPRSLADCRGGAGRGFRRRDLR